MRQGSIENSMAKCSGFEWAAMRALRVRGFLPAALGIVLATLFAATPAQAEADFPDKLQTLAKMPCTPACLLCHTDPAGGKEHLRNAPDGSPWGLLFAFLKAGGTEQSLAPFDTKDSDGDLKTDLAELRENQDPLVKGDAPICSPIMYGCGAHIASKPALDGATSAWALASAAACFYVGRRRSKSRVR